MIQRVRVPNQQSQNVIRAIAHLAGERFTSTIRARVPICTFRSWRCAARFFHLWQCCLVLQHIRVAIASRRIATDGYVRAWRSFMSSDIGQMGLEFSTALICGNMVESSSKVSSDRPRTRRRWCLTDLTPAFKTGSARGVEVPLGSVRGQAIGLRVQMSQFYSTYKIRI